MEVVCFKHLLIYKTLYNITSCLNVMFVYILYNYILEIL